MRELEEKISPLHLEDLQNTIHPSIFDKNPSYAMFIIRLPLIKEEYVEGKSFGFIITQDNSYLYITDNKQFKALGNRFEGIHMVVDESLDKLLKSFTNYADRVTDMEESLYDNTIKNNFMSEWLMLKRDILRVERIMHRTSMVVERLVNAYKETDSFPLDHYLDIHEHCERILRSATLQLSKLDYLYNFYNTRTNEKMNRLIFILTIISAIFLPLNLMVGFFGMNTSGLPFTQVPNGTSSVVTIMGILIIFTIIGVMWWRKSIENSE